MGDRETESDTMRVGERERETIAGVERETDGQGQTGNRRTRRQKERKRERRY